MKPEQLTPEENLASQTIGYWTVLRETPKSTHSPRTKRASKTTPREGVAVVEAAFAEKLETELHEMYLILFNIVASVGIGGEAVHDPMYKKAKDTLAQHDYLRGIATRNTPQSDIDPFTP